MDGIRKKLGSYAETNVRRSTAPGIGVFVAIVAIVAIVAFVAVLAPLGCSPASRGSASAVVDSAAADSIARARQDSTNRTLPGYVVDSILPVKEELRRFRVAIGGDSMAAFKDAAPSRDSLVVRFVRAIAATDTVALRKIMLNAQEFAWLVYPESPYTRPPYTQSPALVWGQIENPAVSGLTRLVRRLGGKPLRYVGHVCSTRPERQGKNVIWTKCTVRIAEPNETARDRRLFGSIIERDGLFKIVSYANEF